MLVDLAQTDVFPQIMAKLSDKDQQTLRQTHSLLRQSVDSTVELSLHHRRVSRAMAAFDTYEAQALDKAASRLGGLGPYVKAIKHLDLVNVPGQAYALALAAPNLTALKALRLGGHIATEQAVQQFAIKQGASSLSAIDGAIRLTARRCRLASLPQDVVRQLNDIKISMIQRWSVDARLALEKYSALNGNAPDFHDLECLGQLPVLTSLSLVGPSVDFLPTGVLSCTALQKLDVEATQIRVVSDKLLQLPNLRTVIAPRAGWRRTVGRSAITPLQAATFHLSDDEPPAVLGALGFAAEHGLRTGLRFNEAIIARQNAQDRIEADGADVLRALDILNVLNAVIGTSASSN